MLTELLYGLFAEVVWGAVGFVAVGGGTIVAFQFVHFGDYAGFAAGGLLLLSGVVGAVLSAGVALALQLAGISPQNRVISLAVLNLVMFSLTAFLHPVRMSQRKNK